MKNGFLRLHAGVLFLYFTFILILCGFCYHPLVQILALVGGLAYCGLLFPAKDFCKMLGFYLIPAILVAITNPIFSNAGETVLFYLNQNPVTQEAFLYGIAMGISLMNVLCWFRIFNTVMTTDRTLHLFGGILPKMTMLLTVTLRTVPNLRRRIRETREVQQALGLYGKEQGYVARLRGELSVIQIVMASAMEDAIETGDSMRGRGFGKPGATRFRRDRFDLSQGIILAGLLLLWGWLGFLLLEGSAKIQFYPVVNATMAGWKTGCFGIGVGFLCFLPAALEVYERIRWKWYISRI
ncbi:MAG: hypothetical protein J6L76_06640 [Clostridia bacterium]|nr:hypothetical protein [Clostridia bacterium]